MNQQGRHNFVAAVARFRVREAVLGAPKSKPPQAQVRYKS
jgi:hypothetical protein